MPLSQRLLTILRFVCAVLFTGAAASVFAVVLRLASNAVLTRLLGARDVIAAFEHLPPAARLTLPAVGGGLAGFVGIVAARGAGGHGVAEILEAVALGRGRIRLSTTLWKALGSFIAIVSGGSLGREGPILQFGAASGSAIARQLGLREQQIRVLVASGTAAGFAAAYNTPLAAILFVLEIVTGVFTLEVLFPVVVATTLATVLTRLAIGGGPIYGLRSFAVVSNREFLAFAALGVLAGLVGPAFLGMLGAGTATFKRLALARPLAGALGGFGVGIITLGTPAVAGNGYEAIQSLLETPAPVTLLVLLLLGKSVATVSSVGSGSPGGVFTPSLFLGATLGGLVGAAVAAISAPGAHGSAGGYALVGMAAMIAATTHAPLMAAVLVFELSGDYAVVLPLLLATTTATFVARRLRPDSVYTEELRRRGIPWEGTLAQRLARAVRARDILESDPPWVESHAPLDEALRVLETNRARVVYVGLAPVRAIDLHAAKAVWLTRLREPGAREPATAGEIAVDVANALPDDTLLALSEKLWNVDWGEIPVVDAAASRLLGVVTRRSLLGAFDRELLQRDVLYTRVVSFEGAREASDFLEAPGAHGERE